MSRKSEKSDPKKEKPAEEKGKRTDKNDRSKTIGDMIDANAPLEKGCRGSCARLLLSPRFDGAISFIIVLNAISIGMEITYDLEGHDTTVFKRLEHFYLIVYTVELGMRYYVSGWRCMKSSWICFDFILVVGGIVSIWILIPLLGKLPPGLGPMQVMRMLRLLRLARAVRLLVAFKTLWMLVRGLLSSTSTILYTFLLMFILVYVWACLGVEIITTHANYGEDEDFTAAVDEFFPSLPATMLTLVQFIFMDGVSDVYLPLVYSDPRLLLYFMMFLLGVSVALMNLVTAVIVEGAIEQAANDKEVQEAYENEKKKKLLAEVKGMFLELDEDGSGNLSREEIEDAPFEVQESLVRLLDKEDYSEVVDVLHTLCDLDDPDGISVDEFCQAVFKLLFSKQPVELFQIQKDIHQMQKEVQQKSMMKRSSVMGMVQGEISKTLGSSASLGSASVGSAPSAQFDKGGGVGSVDLSELHLSQAQAASKETEEILTRAVDKASRIDTLAETQSKAANTLSVQMTALEQRLRKLGTTVNAIREAGMSAGYGRSPGVSGGSLKSLRSSTPNSQGPRSIHGDDEDPEANQESGMLYADLEKTELLKEIGRLEGRIEEQQRQLQDKDSQLLHLFAQQQQTMLALVKSVDSAVSQAQYQEQQAMMITNGADPTEPQMFTQPNYLPSMNQGAYAAYQMSRGVQGAQPANMPVQNGSLMHQILSETPLAGMNSNGPAHLPPWPGAQQNAQVPQGFAPRNSPRANQQATTTPSGPYPRQYSYGIREL